jgi:hypothetical protein
MSRYKIVGQTPRKWGVQLELPSGRRVWVFNAHFSHAPYQPYQLLSIPYADAPFITTAEEAVSEARKGELATSRALTATRINVWPVFTDAFIIIFFSFLDVCLFTGSSPY